MNIVHNLYIITYALLCTCTLLLELVFCIALWVVVVIVAFLSVDSCITPGSAANLVY